MARKVEFTFDPFEISGVDKDSVKDVSSVLEEVSDFVLTEVLTDAASQRSSVDGSKWEALSPDYKKVKKAEGGKPIANLELSGSMLDSLRVVKKGSKLTIKFGAAQSDKADGHNNHSGESTLPLRRSIPLDSDGETFRDGILSGIAQIVDNADRKEERRIEDEAIDELLDSGIRITLRRSR